MKNNQDNIISRVRARAREIARATGVAQVVVEDAEEPGYYYIIPATQEQYSMLCQVVSIETPPQGRERRRRLS